MTDSYLNTVATVRCTHLRQLKFSLLFNPGGLILSLLLLQSLGSPFKLVNLSLLFVQEFLTGYLILHHLREGRYRSFCLALEFFSTVS